MDEFKIISIEKAKNNGHHYINIQKGNFNGKYSVAGNFRVYHDNLICDMITVLPPTHEEMNNWEFEAHDQRSASKMEEMVAAFKEHIGL